MTAQINLSKIERTGNYLYLIYFFCFDKMFMTKLKVRNLAVIIHR